ncbi:MAG TPA: ribonuclease P protein component [Rhodanobacteraceae bacterium]
MTGAGLPREARLRRAAEFAALRQAKGRVRGRFFMLRYGIGVTDTARMGMAVSRRVSTRAVERNRIKRLIRDSFRHQRGQLPNMDILVIAHHDAAGQPGTVLRSDLAVLWSRIQPLKTGAAPGTMAS